MKCSNWYDCEDYIEDDNNGCSNMMICDDFNSEEDFEIINKIIDEDSKSILEINSREDND
jgi:hypothetical protein